MRVRRRSLRKGLVVVGCLVGAVGWPAAGVGGVLILVGAALHLWAKGCLEQNRRLTTAGPYRWTRNPFYLANLLIDAGICCVIGSLWVGVVYAFFFALSYRETIAREEIRLAELFPDAYARYRAAVPRLFPTGRSLPRAEVEGHFSFDNEGLARGAEYARLLGIALAPHAIAAAEVVRRERLSLLAPEHETGLAFVLALPALWIVKLALAETFRRPQTALAPWIESAGVRAGLAVGFLIAAVAIADWPSVGLILLAVVLGLDLLGDRRAARDDSAPTPARSDRRPWRYANAAMAGTVAAALCIVALQS